MGRLHHHPSWHRPRVHVSPKRQAMDTSEGRLEWLAEPDASTAGRSWKATLNGHLISDEELQLRWLAEATG